MAGGEGGSRREDGTRYRRNIAVVVRQERAVLLHHDLWWSPRFLEDFFEVSSGQDDSTAVASNQFVYFLPCPVMLLTTKVAAVHAQDVPASLLELPIAHDISCHSFWSTVGRSVKFHIKAQ